MKLLDIRGITFGNLTAICRAETRSAKGGTRKTLWLVKCECGREKEVSLLNLRSGNSKSCGHHMCPYFLGNRISRTGDEAFVNAKRIYRLYRCRAFSKGHDLSMPVEEFAGIIARPCAYCGAPESNGIDRIDSTKGYVPGNCAPCCKICNSMKNALSIEAFLAKVSAIYVHYAEVRSDCGII